MADHQWGEEDFDWEGLNDCVYIVKSTCVRWGRLGGQSKEKYGTLRFYAQFGNLSLHGLCLPGWYNYGWFPGWLITLDQKVITPFLNKIPFLHEVFFWWQRKVYSHAYWKAMKKHPHLRAEILECADCPEYINGVTRRKKSKLHILGWNDEPIATWVTYGTDDEKP
jgi:hypothetical protein